jgi:hypothetical protein
MWTLLGTGQLPGMSAPLRLSSFFTYSVFTILPFFAETKELGTLRAHEIKMAFFTADTLTEICRRLVTHYFLLTFYDLELWDSDPESFGKFVSCV